MCDVLRMIPVVSVCARFGAGCSFLTRVAYDFRYVCVHGSMEVVCVRQVHGFRFEVCACALMMLRTS